MSLPRKEIQKELENIFEIKGQSPAVGGAQKREDWMIKKIDENKPPKPPETPKPKIIKVAGGTGYRRV